MDCVKKRFDNRKEADDTIRKIQDALKFGRKVVGRRRQNWNTPNRSYYCEHCNGYHLTSEPMNRLSAEFRDEIKHVDEFKKYLNND
jgi:hypothetical protein